MTEDAPNEDTPSPLYGQILDAIKGRTDWEQRQDVFYRMRHGGLRRQSKPFPGAADLHFPLADSLIEKLKPFYFAQLYATETFAALINKRPGQAGDLTTAATQWFDYKLRSCSNFETEWLVAIDRMLGSGSSIFKVYWDAKRKQVRFAAPQVTHVIMPTWTEDIQEADWFVQVMQVSVAQYEANTLFKQDADFVASIKGNGDTASNTGTNNALDQDKQTREGITHTTKADQIVYWEIYVRDHAKGTWTVKTRSPNAFETPLRDDFGLPYKHGLAPFVQFTSEVKEQGVFSSRGVTEIVAPFETSACKTWNQKHDWMTFSCQPNYYTDKDIPGVQNIQFRPGQILPFGLKPVEHAPAPVSLDEEMNKAREIAEYRIALPDFGVLQDKGGKRTATEVTAVAGQSSTVSDIRTRITRIQLAKVFVQAWALLVQYDSEDLSYTVSDAVETLDPTALHTDYQVVPNGSDQSWNRNAQLQRAMARMQAFANSPWINQGELVKSVLEVDDPRLVKRLWQDAQTQVTNQMEEQAVEIGAMLLGFPAQVREADDDVAHLQSLMGFLQRRLTVTNEPITPEQAQLFIAHGSAHELAAQKKKTPGIDQVLSQAKPLIAALVGIMNGQGQPPNLQVMPPPTAGQAVSPDASAAGGGNGDTPANELGVKLLNALAADVKAGLPVTPEQWNAAFTKAGLPGLHPDTKIVPVPPEQPQPQGVAA